MRNPERIKSVCDRIKAEWSKLPDWRFCQLMYNFMADYYQQYGRDCFYVEDDDFTQKFSDYIKRVVG